MANQPPIKHPIAKGTKVKYLSPRCPCSGKRFAVAVGAIIHVNAKAKNGEISYSIRGEKHRIPTKAIMEIL